MGARQLHRRLLSAVVLATTWGGFAATSAAPLTASLALARQASSVAGRTTLDGVYTKLQAESGATAYEGICASCHLSNLAGSKMATPLVGEDFLATWENKPLRSLYSRIISTMPADNVGSLTEKTTVDLVAYILEKNGFPAGGRAQESADALNSITFVRPKPIVAMADAVDRSGTRRAPRSRTFSAPLNYSSAVTIKAEPVGAERAPNITLFDERAEKATTSGSAWLFPVGEYTAACCARWAEARVVMVSVRRSAAC